MNILIIGSGGREHALAWKVAQSPEAQNIYVAPGNAGTELESAISNVDIQPDDINALVKFASENSIGLTIVGPEVPLVAGIVDQFQAADLRIFGPSAKAAQLEGSKSFCKDFLARHNIPTAAYSVFTDLDKACEYINECTAPMVVKADGLAAGKGVVIAETKEQAIAAATDMLAENRFGDAGSKVVVEEFLEGTELSFICMVDGKNCLPMATSQDHKARDDGDTGPNTGGMGAYSPAVAETPELNATVMQSVIEPTIKGMADDGNTFTGFLYAGLMISPQGDARVLEYNVRFGDPETQPIMMRLQSDLVSLCNAAIDGKLDRVTAEWSEDNAVGVVLAAGGYPASYAKGDMISGLNDVASVDEQSNNTKVFHAGTKTDNGSVVTSGGRVLCVTATGATVKDAQLSAYAAVNKISFNKMYCRRDIAYRAIE